jgi:hypothetical protein
MEQSLSEESKKDRKRPRATKDKVLQARIPRDLDEELRDRAGQLGLSVSTVVRNVLLNTFNLVEGVVTDSVQVSRAAQGQAAATGRDKEPAAEKQVFGWQELTLNLNAVCGQCNRILPKGQSAAIGIPVQSPPVFACPDCIANLTDSEDQAND